MPSFDFEAWDNDFYKQSEKSASNITKIIDNIISEACRLATLVNMPADKMFSFSYRSAIKKKADALFKKLSKQLLNNIEIANQYAYDFSDQKNKAFIKYLSKNTGIAVADLGISKPRNISALQAFQNRKEKGLSLSDRVWNYTQQAQSEIELAIDLGLSEGVSAANLSRSVRKNLQNPDTLFRRIRDKRGNLALSKAAKLYNPGRGVYRSSAKNAMRLTRTEINMNYREADYQRWQNLDFVVGIIVRLSNNPNHCPTCRALAGEYPKDFKFLGWHAQCRCNAVPKMMTAKEFNELQVKLLNNESVKITSVNHVPDINLAAKKWYDENKKRIKGYASIPYFIKDNLQYFSS